jgi:integrase
MEQEQYTVNQILDRYVRDCFGELAPRTQRDYLKHIKHLRAWFGERIAAELKPKDFSIFMEVEKGKLNRNKMMAVLSSAFTFAVQRWYWIDHNVCRNVWRHPSKPRTRLIKDAEFAAFRAMVPLRVQLAMDIALRSGQRQGDILSMRWEALSRGKWHLTQAKTGKRLAVKLSLSFKKTLWRCSQLETRGHAREIVILNESGVPYTSDGFRSIWQRSMRAWVAAGNERFTFHDIRALAATKCKTIQEAMLLLGHSNISMTRRVYRRGEEEAESLEVELAEAA